MTTNVFYTNGCIVDFAVNRVKDVDGREIALEIPIGRYSRQNLAELQAESKTDIVLLSIEDAIKRVEDAWVTTPAEIDEKQFFEAIGCLSPLKRQGGTDSDSFRMPEPYTASIHPTYVRIGDRYFCWRERLEKNHEDLVAAIKAAHPGINTH